MEEKNYNPSASVAGRAVGALAERARRHLHISLFAAGDASKVCNFSSVTVRFISSPRSREELDSVKLSENYERRMAPVTLTGGAGTDVDLFVSKKDERSKFHGTRNV